MTAAAATCEALLRRKGRCWATGAAWGRGRNPGHLLSLSLPSHISDTAAPSQDGSMFRMQGSEGYTLDFSQISFVCIITWFAWAGLIRLKGLPNLTEQDWSGWEGVPDLTEQDWSGWEGVPDLPEQDWSCWEGVPDMLEQDWSGWEGCLICMSRIFGTAQKIRQTS